MSNARDDGTAAALRAAGAAVILGLWVTHIAVPSAANARTAESQAGAGALASSDSLRALAGAGAGIAGMSRGSR